MLDAPSQYTGLAPHMAAKKQRAISVKVAEREQKKKMYRYSMEFLADVSASCQVPTGDVRKVLEGIRKTMKAQLKDKKKTRIPNVLTIRVKSIPARAPTTKSIFGVETKLKARPAKKKVLCTALKTFQEELFA